MIAYHYPPCFGSSGLQRTLKFSRHLSRGGWEPAVLTAHSRAYPETSDGQLGEIPHGMPLTRAFAMDAARHVSVAGRYPRCVALPDRWCTWWWGAVPAWLAMIRRLRPAVLWSTYPIATAHSIGLALHRLTGIPWVADFRDPMMQDDFPKDPVTRNAYLKIERSTVSRAARLVFTAESTRTTYLKRYPFLAAERSFLIPNGYDDEDFRGLPSSARGPAPPGRPLRLVHAGIIYPEARDPRPFFRALSALKSARRVTKDVLRIELRAAGAEEASFRALLAEMGLADIVEMLPALPYRQALEDCAAADGLILLQGPLCNHQIPAKAYEYLRLRRPILALTTHEGDTAALLRDTGGATIVDLLDDAALYRSLPSFLAAVADGSHPLASAERVGRYERRHQARQLGECLDALVDGGSAS